MVMVHKTYDIEISFITIVHQSKEVEIRKGFNETGKTQEK